MTLGHANLPVVLLLTHIFFLSCDWALDSRLLLPIIMPTLNELLLLGSRPKQLLLCLIAHRKREFSPNIFSRHHPFNIISLNTVTIKLFTFFML
jgi:hypothetical protein